MIILDCPPNISLLSENVFRVADKIVIPVIPTTLSERTLEQLYDFFNDKKYQKKKLLPFISMMQKRKNLHKETRSRLQKKYKNFLDNSIPFSTDIEKMGVNRAPVLAYAGSSPAAKAYENLWSAIQDKVKF